MRNKFEGWVGKYLILSHYIKRPIYVLSVATIVFISGITFMISNFHELNKDSLPLKNTSQPIVPFAKYNALKNSFAEVQSGLNKAQKTGQNVTLVFIQKGCTDCEKIEGKLTHYYYYYSQLKNNHTRYLMVDMQDVSDNQLQWLVKKIPSRIIYPVLKTPTIVNLKPKNKKWVYKSSFIEKGSTKQLRKVFQDGVSS